MMYGIRHNMYKYIIVLWEGCETVAKGHGRNFTIKALVAKMT